MVSFVNRSSGSSAAGACGCREGVKNDAFRIARGEVGVLELNRGDKCGIALERGCNSVDEDGGEESESEDECRAMRVGPRRDPSRAVEAINGHTRNTTATRFRFTNTIILKASV